MTETHKRSVLAIESLIKKHKTALTNLKNDLKVARTQSLLEDLEPQILAVIKAGRADEFKQSLNQLVNDLKQCAEGEKITDETGAVLDTESEKDASGKLIEWVDGDGKVEHDESSKKITRITGLAMLDVLIACFRKNQ